MRLPIENASPTTVRMNGRDFLAFGGCNYMGLAHDQEVHAALAAALARFGISTTASRETTGNTRLHEQLESQLAAFTGQEAAILSAEGYTANFAACQAIADTCRVALIDSHSHRSLRNAATAAGMFVFEYEHLNVDSAAWLARQNADAGVAILTDSVFAADGAVAPLSDLLHILPCARATLVIDDCHGFAVLGPNGEGAIRHFGLDDERILMTTTLAKGLGCYGGAVIGRSGIIKRVQDLAWVYRSSTPVPPPLAGAALAALRILAREGGARIAALRANALRLSAGLARLGLLAPRSIPGHNAHGNGPTPALIPIFTFWFEPATAMRAVYEHALASGVLAPLIAYPGGPTEHYFRIVVNAMHSPADIDQLVHVIEAGMSAAGVVPSR